MQNIYSMQQKQIFLCCFNYIFLSTYLVAQIKKFVLIKPNINQCVFKASMFHIFNGKHTFVPSFLRCD